MREFDLMAGVGFMEAMILEVRHRTEEALKHAAKVVEKEAKAEIGHYQDEAGQFAAWADLADSTQADRVAQGYPADEPLLRSGDLRDSIGHGVEVGAGHGEAVIGSNSDIAVFQELGTEHIPPRSFLGGALVRKSEEVADILGHGVVKALVGRGVVDDRLEIE